MAADVSVYLEEKVDELLPILLHETRLRLAGVGWNGVHILNQDNFYQTDILVLSAAEPRGKYHVLAEQELRLKPESVLWYGRYDMQSTQEWHDRTYFLTNIGISYYLSITLDDEIRMFGVNFDEGITGEFWFRISDGKRLLYGKRVLQTPDHMDRND